MSQCQATIDAASRATSRRCSDSASAARELARLSSMWSKVRASWAASSVPVSATRWASSPRSTSSATRWIRARRRVARVATAAASAAVASAAAKAYSRATRTVASRPAKAACRVKTTRAQPSNRPPCEIGASASHSAPPQRTAAWACCGRPGTRLPTCAASVCASTVPLGSTRVADSTWDNWRCACISRCKAARSPVAMSSVALAASALAKPVARAARRCSNRAC